MAEVIDPKEVSFRIREIRKNLGLSMTAFAEKIDDKSKSGTISNWETGKNLPNNKRLKRIAELGNISVNELLYGNIHNYVKNIVRNNLADEPKDWVTVNTITNVLIIKNHWSGSFPDENTVIAALENYQKKSQDRKQKEALYLGEGILNVKSSIIELRDNFEKLSDKEKKKILSTIFDDTKNLEASFSSLFEIDIQEVEDEIEYLENE